MFVKNNKEPT